MLGASNDIVLLIIIISMQIPTESLDFRDFPHTPIKIQIRQQLKSTDKLKPEHITVFRYVKILGDVDCCPLSLW
jgi:hypothetical protein